MAIYLSKLDNDNYIVSDIIFIME